VKHIAAIPEQDLQFQFVRGSGPGGQNVNKVATAAQLRFDLAGTQALPPRSRRGCGPWPAAV
jgi:ribosome-associated protein